MIFPENHALLPKAYKLAEARIDLLQIELVRIKLRILLEPPRGPFQSLIQHFLQQISVIFVGQGGSHALDSLLDSHQLAASAGASRPYPTNRPGTKDRGCCQGFAGPL